jgi:hypothetical protein
MSDVTKFSVKLKDPDTLNVKLSDVSTFKVKMNGDVVKVESDNIHVDTTANWNSQIDLVAKKNNIYIYSDYVTGDTDLPGMKVGDGTTYLIDLPFLAGNNDILTQHMRNNVIHVSQADRDFWNNKVTCYISSEDPDTLVFSYD